MVFLTSGAQARYAPRRSETACVRARAHARSTTVCGALRTHRGRERPLEGAAHRRGVRLALACPNTVSRRRAGAPPSRRRAGATPHTHTHSGGHLAQAPPQRLVAQLARPPVHHHAAATPPPRRIYQPAAAPPPRAPARVCGPLEAVPLVGDRSDLRRSEIGRDVRAGDADKSVCGPAGESKRRREARGARGGCEGVRG